MSNFQPPQVPETAAPDLMDPSDDKVAIILHAGIPERHEVHKSDIEFINVVPIPNDSTNSTRFLVVCSLENIAPLVNVQVQPIISKEVGFTKQVVEELFSEEETDAEKDTLKTAHSSVPMLNTLKLVPGTSNFSAGNRSQMGQTRADILNDLCNSSQQLNKAFAERSLAKHSKIMAKYPLVDQTEMVVDYSMNLTEIAVLVDEDDFIPVQKKKRGRPRKTVKK